MSSDTAPLPVSPLRARMIEDMIVRGFKEDTPRLRAKRPSIRGLHWSVARHIDSEDLRLVQLVKTQILAVDVSGDRPMKAANARAFRA